jgi:Kef-type K+ transport system membrane component KefB
VATGLSLWTGPPPLLAEALTKSELRSLVWILGASMLGALLSRIHSRVRLPTVVVEIVIGIVIGPEVLDLARPGSYTAFLSQLGLGFLFFFAGLEVIERRVPTRAVARGTIGWGISIGLGLAAGVALDAAGVDAVWWLLGVAFATTALGTLVPILSDAGILATPLGTATLGTGVAGEFWPIVVISVFLTGAYGAGLELILLVLFGGLVAATAVIALRARPPRAVQILRETVHTTGQAAVRVAVFVLGALVLVAIDVGFDFVLGAFAAGLVVGLALASPEGELVRMRLEGIGFGFLIPIYFVVTGLTYNLDALLRPGGLALAALFLGLLLVVRGASALLWLRRLGRTQTGALALFGATGLPLIVAVVGIGTDRGAVGTDVGASLIGAGMISVLVFPVIGTRLAGPVPAGGAPATEAEAEAFDEY